MATTRYSRILCPTFYRVHPVYEIHKTLTEKNFPASQFEDAVDQAAGKP